MLRLVACAALVLTFPGAAWGQEADVGDADVGEEIKETYELLKAFYRHEAELYEFTLDEAGSQKLTIQPTVMTWVGQDYQEEFKTVAPNSGEVYIWTYQGRAVVAGGIGSFPFSDGRGVFHEFHILTELAPRPTSIHSPQRAYTWRPPGEPPQPIPGASAPAIGSTPTITASRRLAQMRALAQEFLGSTTKPDETGQAKLRLLRTPIYRLDPEALETDKHDVVDGAVFVFTGEVGTDPEMLLNIECRKTEEGFEWTYVPASMTYLPMWLEHKGKEVWRMPHYDNDGGEHNYFTAIVERIRREGEFRERLQQK